MSISKINDTELFNQKRYHVNQSDVPGKTAQEMKEFFDYLPRQIIIPKINELVDTANAAAPAQSVYTKTETDGLLDTKADADSVYKKTETYNKSEADGYLDLKADASQVYTKTQTDSMLSQKADIQNVYDKTQIYTKTQTDSLLDLKTDNDSKNVIQDVSSQPSDQDTAFICREDTQLKLYKNGYISAPSDGDKAEVYLSPALCVYDSSDDLDSAIESHGLTDKTENNTSCIHLMDLYNKDGTLIDKLYIVNVRTLYYLDNYDQKTDHKAWSSSVWAAGTADVLGHFEQQGYSDIIIQNVSDFAKQVFRAKETVYEKIATEKYVQQKFDEIDTYTTAQTDSMLAQKLDADSEQIIINTDTDPTGFVNDSIFYRKDGVIKLRSRSLSEEISSGTAADSCISPALPCAFGNVESAVSAIQSHGLTDSTLTYGSGIRLFDLALAESGSSIVDPIYIVGGSSGYFICNADNNYSTKTWTLAEWINGSVDLCSYFESQGVSGPMYVTNISEFGRAVLRTGEWIYSPVATLNDLQNLAVSLQNMTNQLSAKLSDTADGQLI